MNNLSFLNESGDNRDTVTIGGFTSSRDGNKFEAVFESAYDKFKEQSIDIMTEPMAILKDPYMFESYKDQLLSGLKEQCEKFTESAGLGLPGEAVDIGTYGGLYDQIDKMFDNCRDDLIKESAIIGSLLPVKMVDFPLIMKHQLQVASKDIMQCEVTPTPIIKKHIERTYVVDKAANKSWEYPQCFFNDEFKQIYEAGKGFKLKSTPVNIPCVNFNIVTLSDATVVEREEISINTKIIAGVLEDGTQFPLDMRINVSDGQWLGGNVMGKTVKKADDTIITLNDCITGIVDFSNSTTTISCATGVIKQVVFSGYLSNEKNERTVSFDWKREEREWKVEDGTRAEMPWSLEQLDDAKALLKVDLYQKSYDKMADYLVQMEDNDVLNYLDEEYVKYKGSAMDPLGFNPVIREQSFDCDSTVATVALPCEYVEKQLKFLVDRFIIDICDTTKLDDLTFVCYGNPRYISLLSPHINWVVKNGDMIGGVKLNYSYGIMNSGGVKIQVVSTNKVDSVKHPGLRFIPYPMSTDQFTFKHYKYTSHIVTNANSAYRSADRPGGSYTLLTGVSRYANASIQGIQGHVGFTNDNFILKH